MTNTQKTLEKITEISSMIKIYSYCGPYRGLKLVKGKSPTRLEALCHKIEYKIATKPREYSHVCAESEEVPYRYWPNP